MRWAGAILSAALLCATARAQTPASVTVLSDETQVLVGRTVKMRAVVRDSQGNHLPAAAVTWSMNQAQAGSIAPDGTVAPRGLATFRVTARSGAVAGEAAIQSVPSRVEVTPASAEIDVGGQMQFRAAAYDADGSVIPNVAFAWSLTNLRQGSSSLGRVDTAGLLSGTGEGGVWVWATYTYNEVFPGLQRQWVAYAPVTISVPKSYELRRLYHSGEQKRQSWTLRARQSMIWSTDEGELLFNASLEGLANGLMSWKDGAWRLLSAGGAPRFGRGSTAIDFRTHSVTRDGKILSYEDTNINGAELNRGTREGLEPFLNNNVPLGETEATTGLFMTRNSYTSSGSILVRANFRFENNPVGYTGFFRGFQGRVDELLVSTRDRLAEINGAISFDGDFGIASDGTAYYAVVSGATRVIYRHDFGGRRKVLGTGDALLDSRVRRFIGGRANSPAFWVDEDGTVLLCVELEDGSQRFVSFDKDGKTSGSLRVNSQGGILGRHPAHGTLLYANPFNNRGNGVHLWRGEEVNPVLLLGRRLYDQAIQEIESGTVNRQGEVTLLLRGEATPLIAARMGPEPYVLFSAGDAIPVEAPVNLFTLVGGARTGPPHAIAGGSPGSVAEFDGADWRLTLGIGERLFGTTMWFGGAHGTTYNVRKAPNGDLYAITGQGIARIAPGGEPELVLRFPLRIDTLTVNNPGQIELNSQGAVLFHSSTSAGDNRFFLHQNGVTRQLLVLHPSAATASVLDNGTVNSFDSFALDDAGRVLAPLRFRGQTAAVLYAWDGNRWRAAAVAGQTRVGPHLITAIPNLPRASGTRLLAGLTISTGGVIAAEWKDGSWELLLSNTTPMPNGQVANSVPALEVNTRGDVLFQFANGVTSLAMRRDSKLHQVHNFFRPTPEGDYLIRINAMDFRDDGTAYFLAVTAEDEVVLYEARPVF